MTWNYLGIRIIHIRINWAPPPCETDKRVLSKAWFHTEARKRFKTPTRLFIRDHINLASYSNSLPNSTWWSPPAPALLLGNHRNALFVQFVNPTEVTCITLQNHAQGPTKLTLIKYLTPPKPTRQGQPKINSCQIYPKHCKSGRANSEMLFSGMATVKQGKKQCKTITHARVRVRVNRRSTFVKFMYRKYHQYHKHASIST